jgi:hypothetical protein
VRPVQKIQVIAFLITTSLHAGTFRDIAQYCFSENNKDLGIHWLEQCLQTVFSDDPYHLTMTVVAPGTGVAIGPAFELIPRVHHYEFLFTGLAAVSTDGSTIGQAQLNLALPSRGLTRQEVAPGPNGQPQSHGGTLRKASDVRASLTLGARRINARAQDFYGIGPNTSLSGEAGYGVQLTELYTGFSNPLSSWSSVGFNTSALAPRVTSSINTEIAPMAQKYNADTAPGLYTRDDFVHYEPYVMVRVPPRGSFSTTIRAGYSIFQDVGDSRYSFKRITATSTTTIPLWVPSRNTPTHRPPIANIFCPSLRSATRCSIGTVVLTASVVASYTGGSDHVVPFYFDSMLGGVNFQDVDTLRGFQDYRFRGPSSELFQAEYLHPIWGPIGVLSFYDLGNVALRPGDLSFGGMRHDIGAGIYLHAGNRELVRFYIAFGSGEGSRYSYKFPAAYQ